MSDMIDSSTGRDAIAYVGETPWHNKGRQLTVGAPIEQWIQEAGLAYNVIESPISYWDKFKNAYCEFPGRKALYRSDTGGALSVMSSQYRTVQPEQIVRFFDGILSHAGATMEVAGALDDGKRVWALAKLAQGADILDGDIVEPYLLAATSYDGTMSSTFKLTAIRVVCHNTITAAVGYQGEGQSEKGREGGTIRVPHDQDFDPDNVRIDLGITFDTWERFLFTSRKLARTPVDEAFAIHFLKLLLPLPTRTQDGKKIMLPLEDSKAYSSIMALFNGAAMGSDHPAAAGTAYGLLNAVTEYVDHDRGGDRTRLSSAWFGSGEGMKNRALEILVDVTA